jgi:hypothetical protein
MQVQRPSIDCRSAYEVSASISCQRLLVADAACFANLLPCRCQDPLKPGVPIDFVEHAKPVIRPEANLPLYFKGDRTLQGLAIPCLHVGFETQMDSMDGRIQPIG